MQPKQVSDAVPVQETQSNSAGSRRQTTEAVRPLAICLTPDQHRMWEIIKEKLRRKGDEAAFVRLLGSETMQRIVEELQGHDAIAEEVTSGTVAGNYELDGSES